MMSGSPSLLLRLCSATPTCYHASCRVSSLPLSPWQPLPPQVPPIFPLQHFATITPAAVSQAGTRWLHSSTSLMSGSNRWSKIKHKKAAADQAKNILMSKHSGRIRSNLFITGNADPETNFKLACLINQARADGMTKSAVESILKSDHKKGPMDQVMYEARAQAGFFLLIDVLTANRNKCLNNLRKIMNRNDGALGDPGSSLFNFIHKGIVEVPYQELESSATDADELGIEAGAEEVLLEEATSEPDQPSTDLTQAESESMDLNCKRYQFICDPRDVSAVAAVIKKRSFTVLSATQDYSPKTLVKLDQEEFEKAEKLVQILEEHEDVIDVYDNFVLKED